MNNEQIKETAFVEDDALYGSRIKAVPADTLDIGVDIDSDIIRTLAEATVADQTDISKLQSFTNVTRTRNELYDTLDYMAQDTTLAAVLETYAEDATETNDNGDIVWCEADDSNISKYITFLLNSLNINKNVFKWTYNLCKYGDVYLRLYRESDVEDSFFNKKSKKQTNSTLNEDVRVHGYSKTDNYVHYLEMTHNPAQLFELTRFGKTAGYVKTNVEATSSSSDNISSMFAMGNRYKFNSDSSDVDLFPGTEWVHGCLEGDTTRTPEEVELFSDVDDHGNIKSTVYTVRRGESLLYDSYKTWRELMLLENSVLLNRVTQSSIVRVIGVEVGDMPKENVQPHLMNIKHLIEQRTALDVGKGMGEYTSPGPIVNNIYIPTRNNKGVLSTQQIGGDVQVGELVDLAYYEDKLFGGLRVPKQYFGRTDDAAGFSGGSSLALISSRYAKMVKRIQSVITQMITDAINLILIDTDNDAYINKFSIKMLSPTTQEEVDRRENLANRMGLVNDIMTSVADIEDVATRLKILKSLLSDFIGNVEVISLIQSQIDALEAEQEESEPEDFPEDTEDLGSLFGDESTSDFESALSTDSGSPEELSDTFLNTEEPTELTSLPSPEELGIGDLSDSTNPELG